MCAGVGTRLFRYGQTGVWGGSKVVMEGDMYTKWSIFSGIGKPMGQENVNNGEYTGCRCRCPLDNLHWWLTMLLQCMTGGMDAG